MKKINFSLFLAFFLIFCFSACKVPTELPTLITPPSYPEYTPDDSPENSVIELETTTIYYPANSTEDSANYRLTYTIPKFSSESHIHADELNSAVSHYLDTLLIGVSQERVPYADSTELILPYTDVTCSVRFARGYTNIVFTDESSFGSDVVTNTHVIVADEQGIERSLGYVVGLYDPNDIVGQQILQIIRGSDDSGSVYYHDIELSNISAAIDLFNGYEVTSDGFIIYIDAGVVSAYGSHSFEIPSRVLQPGFVGDIISTNAFSGIRLIIDDLLTAITMQGQTSFNGTPDPYSAAYTMANYFLNGDYQRTEGAILIDKADYDAAYFGIFDTDILQSLPANADFVTLNEDTYAITDTGINLFYGMDYQDAFSDDLGAITLVGRLMSGHPGGSVSCVSTRVEICLIPDETSLFGYNISSIAIV
ncbi:MAG: hypothetical protein IJA35_03630 [Clostridia bacterium]|nr:hypothetical protein [Clostridia bacterium]